jgi:roadblock/LC7 domain-containing protein
MNSFKKRSGIFSRLLFALVLAFALLNLISCGDLSDLLGGSQDTTQPSNPGGNNPQTPNSPTSYHDFPNFNPDNYPVINESGKSDSAIADLRDAIWLMYAEKEDIGDWLANYVRTNNIKTILSNKNSGQAWIDPNQLDRLYLGERLHNDLLSLEMSFGSTGNGGADTRGAMHSFATHETMHLVQYGSGAFNLMVGMRPDICAAVNMLTEFLANFYTSPRYYGTYITTDMKDAVETQSKYMVLSIDPDAYEAARAKDPSLPPYIQSSNWFENYLGAYAEQAFLIGIVITSAFTPPLREASKEDMLKVARAMLACRDPKQAGVTDEALWTVFDALRKTAVGENKYLKFGAGWGCSRETFDWFQSIIAFWDEDYAAQQSQ